MTRFLKANYLRSPYKLIERYGKEDSWVVVTGGSDGIGAEICEQMAKEGFNICIVGRNSPKTDEAVEVKTYAKAKEPEKKKIDVVLAKLQKTYPKIKTLAVIADFAAISTIKEYQEQVGDKVKDIDIAILFLNAGVIFQSNFRNHTPEQVQAEVGVNALQPIYMTKVLLDQILARGKLSALVVTSSGLAQLPVPGVTTYCAAKSFASFLAVGLSYELEGKVDCMTWEASKMATKLSNAEAGGNVASRPQAVSGMLKHLGSERLTNGCTRHAWDCAILNALPRSILYEMFKSKLSRIEAKMR